MKRLFLIALAVLLTHATDGVLSSQPVQGNNLSYRLTLNKENPIYNKGEKVIISCNMNGTPKDSMLLRVSVNNNPAEQFKVLPSRGNSVILERSYEQTCAVSIELQGGQWQSEGVGFVVAPEGFKAGYDEPDDLMDYWNNLKRQLKKLPMQVTTKQLEVPQQYRDGYECQDIEINCLGPAPVRAYMAKPKNARKKSLPIIILCRAAGVSGDWCRCQVGECVSNAAKGSKGALSLDLNAHGMLNGQSTEYYQGLENGMLRNYYEYNVADRETYYFKGMYLRLLRAIEFMTRQPEWDGKRILVIGESQGGGQAVAAAGLDNRVSAVVLNVPAMQDFGGARAGRRSGWPQPIENHRDIASDMIDNVLPYFDGAQLIKHSKAEIYCEMGMIDTTCPPSGVWSSLNNAKGKKTINCVPFRTHAWPSGQYRAEWDEKYYYPRLEFIDNYLK